MPYRGKRANLAGQTPPPGRWAALRARLAASARNPMIGYPMSLVSVVVAGLLTQVFYDKFFTRNPFTLFYAAVVLSAWVGGLGPGLCASFAAVVAINHMLMPSFGTTPTDATVEVCTFA